MTYPPGGQPPQDRPHYPQQQPTSQPPPMGHGNPPPMGHGSLPPGQGHPPPMGNSSLPPGYPPPGSLPGGYPPRPPKKSWTGLIAGSVALVALVIAGAVIVGALLTSQGKGPLSSDEKKIELAIRDFYEVLGAHGFRAAAEKACAADRAEFDAMTEEQKKEFDAATVSVTIERIEGIVVTGRSATANITGKLTVAIPGETPDSDTSTTEHLRKEDGQWKVCSAPGST
ncbi:hypothetical protein OHB12_30600 [Nocardia sp. NBC_01730]|uniref:Rv0361 family membrane protein n=1 Tax=Nocardia sp. NBC_01730 TaxID=2975998 RepID=UPI002E113E38|nr:hypothetical protein OHB12_30600 [Nocardia sp. NBC_01730]